MRRVRDPTRPTRETRETREIERRVVAEAAELKAVTPMTTEARVRTMGQSMVGVGGRHGC